MLSFIPLSSRLYASLSQSLIHLFYYSAVLGTQVTRAFGSRAVPKFAELLLMDDLNDEGRARALLELHELLSNQVRLSVTAQ